MGIYIWGSIFQPLFCPTQQNLEEMRVKFRILRAEEHPMRLGFRILPPESWDASKVTMPGKRATTEGLRRCCYMQRPPEIQNPWTQWPETTYLAVILAGGVRQSWQTRSDLTRRGRELSHRYALTSRGNFKEAKKFRIEDSKETSSKAEQSDPGAGKRSSVHPLQHNGGRGNYATLKGLQTRAKTCGNWVLFRTPGIVPCEKTS